MPTRLSRYVDGLMEAAWLAAIVAVPLFFNVYSSRTFEPDKIAILRTLSLVILAAWLVKLLEEGGIRWELIQPEKSWLKTLLGVPFVVPIIALCLIYVISTILSVNPRVSFFGSFQRFQGTYTTFSYIIIFAAIAANLRRREQVERLVTMVILTSFPVSLYGVLQRFQIDPLSWGYDVSNRIAPNLGNSIFVGAYMIMVFPLTVYRIVDSFGAMLRNEGRQTANFALATAYVFIASLQLIALYLTGSRGPWLGWLAGSLFILILLSLIWRKRWMTISIVVMAVLGAGFLVILNIPSGPLEQLRSVPGVGRLSQLLDAESATGRVRVLVWEGVADLVTPHDPLEFPDGRLDAYNSIRPLVGYGPESMYVTFPPFYPPELANLERRNASPDRAHNESWDALVRTGVFGLVAYLFLFGTIFYYGLKWLGLIAGRNQRIIFLALYIGTGILSAILFIAWFGVGFFGLGLSFGMIIGLLIYLIYIALFGSYQSLKTKRHQLRALIITGLMAAILAHFVEISFGIAISVPRTYFWTFSALILVVGYVLPLGGELEIKNLSNQANAKNSRRKGKAVSNIRRRRRRRRPEGSASQNWYRDIWSREGVLNGFLAALILVPLGYNFITDRGGAFSIFEVIWESLTELPGLPSTVSYGALAMILLAWLIPGIILASESSKLKISLPLGKLVLTGLVISLVLGLIYWFWQAVGVASINRSSPDNVAIVLANLNRYTGLLSKFFIYYLGIIFGAAFFMPEEWPIRTWASKWIGLIAVPTVFALVLYLSSILNMRVIQADIAFNFADSLSSRGSHPAAVETFKQVINLAPTEDFYYLSSGRANLAYAQSFEESQQRDIFFSEAAEDLQKAQELNPLHPDHTANLARLYNVWATYANEEDTKTERAEVSSEFFASATTISPNNSRLWNEWGILYLSKLQQPELAYQRFMRALEIDPQYDWTYALIGDYYRSKAQESIDLENKKEMLISAAENYKKAIELAGPDVADRKYSYILALAWVYTQLNDPQKAISTYEQGLILQPDNQARWQLEEAIGELFVQVGDDLNALKHYQAALSAAPVEQSERLEEIIARLQSKE